MRQSRFGRARLDAGRIAGGGGACAANGMTAAAAMLAQPNTLKSHTKRIYARSESAATPNSCSPSQIADVGVDVTAIFAVRWLRHPWGDENGRRWTSPG